MPGGAVVLCAPQPTPYDLCFRIFGFPVRVHPLFWLTMILFGDTNIDRPHSGARIAIWVAVVFGSILLHELGHAFAYRFYRCYGVHIQLYMFGGLAAANQRPAGHWPNIFISLAGPAAQLMLCGLVWGSDRIYPWAELADPYTFYLYIYLILINLYWPIFNLLPIWPLDGGQVMREVCFLMKVPQPEAAAMKISIATAVAVCVLGIVGEFGPPGSLDFLPWWFPMPSLFGVLLFGSLAYSAYENLKLLQGYRGFRQNDW
jgi:stage IV sporulation protein FB